MDKGPLNWQQFVQWLFYGLLSLFGTIVSGFLFNIQISVKEMSASIVQLNQSMAVNSNITQYQEKEIQDHGRRLDRLERRKGDL
jgi:hypothetical protein